MKETKRVAKNSKEEGKGKENTEAQAREGERKREAEE